MKTEAEIREALDRLMERYTAAVKGQAPRAYLNGLFMATETLLWTLGNRSDGLEHPYEGILEGRS